MSFAKVDVFFSPEGGICSKLIEKINNAKKRVYVAVYMFTDKSLADALVEAKNRRGLDVQIVTDKKSVEFKYGKINYLKERGVEVFVFNPRTKSEEMFRKKMHHKFALFDNSVCTGSYNWTRQADKKNSENITFFDDIDACKKYEYEFKKLKKVCVKGNVLTNKMENTKKNRKLKEKVVDMLKCIKVKFS
jgi:cardiolipin hydrolase